MDRTTILKTCSILPSLFDSMKVINTMATNLTNLHLIFIPRSIDVRKIHRNLP